MRRGKSSFFHVCTSMWMRSQVSSPLVNHTLTSLSTIFRPCSAAAVGVLKVGGIFVHKGGSCCVTRKCTRAMEATMPSTPPSPEQRAEAQALAQAIREAVAAEIDQLADTLLATDDRHVFGQTEFAVRDLAHKIAAKAYE